MGIEVNPRLVRMLMSPVEPLFNVMIRLIARRKLPRIHGVPIAIQGDDVEYSGRRLHEAIDCIAQAAPYRVPQVARYIGCILVTSQPARHGSYNHSRRLCVLDGRSLRLDPPSATAMTIVGAVTKARLCRRGFEYRSDLTPRVLQLYEKTRQVFTQQLERRPHGSAA